MAEDLLGLGFDVHGGGSDLIFPHHENEAAQTQAARGAPLARLWMHNGMVQLDRDKMAKSSGNIVSLQGALDEYGRDALIMYFCSGHYRQPLAFSDDELEQARARVQRVRDAARRLSRGAGPPDLRRLRDDFFAALADDFNTPAALGALFEWIREANKRDRPGDADLREMLAVLALDNLLPDADAREPDAEARALADRREAARSARDFAHADRLRDQLRGRGWEVRDGADGPELVPLDR
jgi:cysteinyl-tRNA synthetase